jgi:hypothetical protein
MKVKNVGSNMTELSLTDGTVVLFSYETPVAAEWEGEIYRTTHKWSQTTTRHINKWLEGRTAQDAYQTFFDDLVRGV